MKTVNSSQTRQEYINTQIARSKQKFSYCKVSYSHVIAWRQIAAQELCELTGPVLCLGTRNGREIDLFRTIFFRGKVVNFFVNFFEKKKYGWRSRVSFLESLNRSSIDSINNNSVIGVEINPDARRRDTWSGSFDQMPLEWENKFNVVYSNSFDQSHDPYSTAREWGRVCKPGGLMILGFSPEAEPTETDPVGRMTYEDLLDLFGGELVYYNRSGTHYSDAILKMNK